MYHGYHTVAKHTVGWIGFFQLFGISKYNSLEKWYRGKKIMRENFETSAPTLSTAGRLQNFFKK